MLIVGEEAIHVEGWGVYTFFFFFFLSFFLFSFHRISSVTNCKGKASSHILFSAIITECGFHLDLQ